ncbi:MAG TPA: xanthine dehydrogenase family protein molybdopterin-binding subunit [Candidatus Methylomirabilis sp.]
MAGPLFGEGIRRKEDPRFLTGQGRYVGDLVFSGMLHAAFLRSAHAHARILHIEADDARKAPGVVAVVTGPDLGGLSRLYPVTHPHPALRAAMSTPLTDGRARYVGEPIAAVVAEDRYQAEDALDRIAVGYEPLPVVADAAAALAAGAPALHEALGNNIAGQWREAVGDIERALAGAPHVLRERIRVSRGTGAPIECRGTIAVPDPTGRVTLWTATQTPHLQRRVLAEMLGLPQHQVRVVAPDVGGAFGTKARIFAEDAVLAWLALRLGRPVKWIEDRREDLLSTYQERDQIYDVEVGARADGTLTGLRIRFLADGGAYSTWGLTVPLLAIQHVMSAYKLPAFAVEATVAYINRVPIAPVRGAGRPVGSFVMDRVVDLVARDLRLDPAEIRFRNLIQPHEFPYRTGLAVGPGRPQTFDSGDYPACLQKAMDMVDYPGLRRRQAELRRHGRHLGVGIACCVESTGIGPFEGATVRVEPGGTVVVITGSGQQGQGHETTLAQVCADAVGVPLEAVHVVAGDTDAIALGVGTFSSRVASVSASAVLAAARAVRARAAAAGARLLEARAEDLVIEAGKLFVRGAPARAVPLGRLASLAAGGQIPGPREGTPGLEATEFFYPENLTYANGTVVAVVEVDPDTGGVRFERLLIVHDCGRIINPLIVDGQIVGGIAHGIGNVLYEDVPCDATGQPLAATFMDYLLPSAPEVPPVEIAHQETPSPVNPAGVKGAGEGGTIPTLQAVAAAVEDALAPFGVRITRLPLSPERIRGLVAAAKTTGS